MGAGNTPAPSKQKFNNLIFTASHISGGDAGDVGCRFAAEAKLMVDANDLRLGQS